MAGAAGSDCENSLVLGGHFAPVGAHDDEKTTAASAVSIRDQNGRGGRNEAVMEFGRIKWEVMSEDGSRDDIV